MSTSPKNVIRRHLGKDGPSVSALGFGSMGLSAAYGKVPPDEESLDVLRKAVELGATFIDTADVYGYPMGTNERLIGQLLKDKDIRSKVFICTKLGLHASETGIAVRGDPAYVREQCEQSLKNLNVDCIDLYYQHREGKVKYLGISEASADEIRRAHAIVKISAYQIEFSPWSPDIRVNGLLKVCRELGIAVVAYSPLGRGFLTGAYRSLDDFEKDDFRRMIPRFQGDAFALNLKLVDALKEMATKKNITPSQLTLAWVLAQGEDFITIPGTKKEKYLIENMGALDVKLDKDDLTSVDAIIAGIESVGSRKNDILRADAF